MPSFGLVDLGEAPKGDDDVEAVTITENSGHGDGAGELLEILGARVVGHPVECDSGV